MGGCASEEASLGGGQVAPFAVGGAQLQGEFDAFAAQAAGGDAHGGAAFAGADFDGRAVAPVGDIGFVDGRPAEEAGVGQGWAVGVLAVFEQAEFNPVVVGVAGDDADGGVLVAGGGLRDGRLAAERRCERCEEQRGGDDRQGWECAHRLRLRSE